MNSIKVVGIDLAKSVFQVCVWMSDGTVASNRKIPRNKLLDTLRQFPANTLIAMEACATSHYWGRTFKSIGLLVRLIPTQHVKAFGDVSDREMSLSIQIAVGNTVRRTIRRW